MLGLFNPIKHIYLGGVILHTPPNFWAIDDRELKFYMVIEIHKLFPKMEKKVGWKC